MAGIHWDVVADNTYRIKREVSLAANRVLRKAGLDIEARAKVNITEANAIDTGAARASIHTQTHGHMGYSAAASAAQAAKAKRQAKLNKQAAKAGLDARQIGDAELFPAEYPNAGEVIVAVAVHYGAYIELGTVTMPARPYLGPAAAEVMAVVDDLIATELNTIFGG